MLQIYTRNAYFAHKYFLSTTEILVFSLFNHFLQNSFDHFANPPAALQTVSADKALVLALLNSLPQTPHTLPEKGLWWLFVAPWHIYVAVLRLISHL